MSRATRDQAKRHRRRESVEQMLRAYDSSNLTQADFARANRIALSTLQYWLRRRREDARGSNAAPALIPVTLRAVSGGISARIEIALVNGRELRLPADTDPGRVAALVAALDS